MGVTQLYRDAHILEAAVNYTKADEPLTTPPRDIPDDAEQEWIYDDRGFWYYVFGQPNELWGRYFKTTSRVTISEWVPRVPGLTFRRESQAFKEFADREFMKLNGDIPVYTPIGKSSVVMGGTGTLKLPPDDQGRRLVSISTSMNASAGIPLLIYPEVWDYHKLKEGSAIQGTFQWRKMDSEWVHYFMGEKNIIRGYLEVKHPDQIEVEDQSAVMAHPFTIMEYEKNGNRLYDFMFFTLHPNADKTRMNTFLKEYASSNGNGRYLLECDAAEPIFNGEYSSPADFRANGKEHLEYMQTRMNEALQGNELQEMLHTALNTHYYAEPDLVRLSAVLGIPPNMWNIGGPAADYVVAFLNEVNSRNKVPPLMETIRQEHPEALNTEDMHETVTTMKTPNADNNIG